MDEFTTRTGEVKKGNIIRVYKAWENADVRYIFLAEDRREYRCIKRDNKYVEYVA